LKSLVTPLSRTRLLIKMVSAERVAARNARSSSRCVASRGWISGRLSAVRAAAGAAQMGVFVAAAASLALIDWGMEVSLYLLFKLLRP
jgi:hypothetical protein